MPVVTFVNVDYPAETGPHGCPCCGYRTLTARGRHETCPVCGWVDDGQDDHAADEVRSTVNGPMSLAKARLNVAMFGACERRRLPEIRAARPEEGPQQFRNVWRPAGKDPYACPCCGYLTLEQRGMHDICHVCFWEDDGQDDHDADDVRGMPNYNVSLAKARLNFAEFGAYARRSLVNIRAPREEEIPK